MVALDVIKGVPKSKEPASKAKGDHKRGQKDAQSQTARIEAIKSMRFASFLKVNLKQIPRKFSKWPVESFDSHVIYFSFPDGQKFQVTPFDRGKLQEKFQHISSPLLLQRTKDHFCSRSFLKYVKDCQFMLGKLFVSMTHYKEFTAAKMAHFDGLLFFLMPSFSLKLELGQLYSESPIAMNMPMTDANISGKRDEPHKEVVKDQVKQESNKDNNNHNQVTASTFILDVRITGEKDDDHQMDDSAPLRFMLREST
ncbi:hypothetical protein Cgig2_012848 [Carnegiea gigantea]|uniref:Uncharacterized protein n=1 Tax=Carnegiea gigantea TaxID=171969 RepID=A0A9Q1JLJ9_9CARY|nr:hypothetical protein Cgig2_012848 [Carnegiea gigantea]